MDKETKEIMMKELKRLTLLNDRFEEQITKGKSMYEPERKILNNIISICEITKLIKN